MTGRVPASFAELVSGRLGEGYESGDEWLARIPRLVCDLLSDWELEVDGPTMHGSCALVLPVRRAGGEPAALKVTWPHVDALHEHLALRAWDGRGSVRLLAADPSRWAMLLERLDPARDLYAQPIDDACGVIGDLLREQDLPALPQLARLSDTAARNVVSFAAAQAQVPRRFVERATSLARDLAADPGVDDRLVHTDLHYWNVLAAERQPWLAIDPKPLAAEPAYAVAPALWNRWDEALASNNVRRHLRRRLEVICEHADVDADRARGWTVVREVENALWAIEDADGPARVTMAVAIIKAMQPG